MFRIENESVALIGVGFNFTCNFNNQRLRNKKSCQNYEEAKRKIITRTNRDSFSIVVGVELEPLAARLFDSKSEKNRRELYFKS